MEERKDIIAHLSRWHQDHVIEQIFGYLDYQSLVNSGSASEEWREHFLNRRLWKQLFRRNIIFPEWQMLYKVILKKQILHVTEEDNDFPRLMCCAIGSSLQRLKHNWSTGVCKSQQVLCGPSCEYPGDVGFEMNDLYIARGLQDGRIFLFNRWSLEVAHVFFCAINDDPEEEHDSAVLQCVQLGENIVVAGYRDGIICVWDLTTKELIHVWQSEMLPDDDEDEPWHFSTESLRLKGKLLLSYKYKPVEAVHVFVLRHFHSPREASISYRRVVHTDPLTVFDMHMDESLIVLLQETNHRHFQIRCTASFTALRVIPILQMKSHSSFDYSNGFIATGVVDDIIRIWNVDTGVCVSSLCNKELVNTVRFINEKYIVGCSESGRIRIWNLEEALRETSASFKIQPLADHLSVPVHAGQEHVDFLSIRADPFQIVSLSKFLKPGGDSILHVHDFWNTVTEHKELSTDHQST